ncbi:hypothetical protein [Hydrogenimonas sp.]
MTTGEKLLDMSTLSTGTALDHFLNIKTGGSVISGAVELDMIDVSILADVQEMEAAFDIEDERFDIDIEDPYFEADIEQEALWEA